MCTTITETIALAGSAKGPHGWFRVERANVGNDHPFHATLEHALTLDFVDETGLADRVAVELTLDAARRLLTAIQTTVTQAEAYEASLSRRRFGRLSTPPSGGGT
jgi:Family of unknown function (DUF6295)